LATSGVKEIIEELKKIEGSNVWIHIGNDLYGNQNLKCAFHLLNNEEHLGFLIGEQKIYVEKKNICNVGIKGELLYFADEIMCIKIRKL
jgi:hypothetical protein